MAYKFAEFLEKFGKNCECLYKYWSWVQIQLKPTFYSYFKESFSDEYHIVLSDPRHEK